MLKSTKYFGKKKQPNREKHQRDENRREHTELKKGTCFIKTHSALWVAEHKKIKASSFK